MGKHEILVNYLIFLIGKLMYLDEFFNFLVVLKNM